jgi:hypothetical protein
LTVINDGTYLVYARTVTGKSARFKMRMYGEQAVTVTTTSMPNSVICSNPRLKVLEVRYNKEAGTTSVTLNAHDIQGESGELTLEF